MNGRSKRIRPVRQTDTDRDIERDGEEANKTRKERVHSSEETNLTFYFSCIKIQLRA